MDNRSFAQFPGEGDTPVRVGSLRNAQWLMAQALRVGEWERSMTHETLLPYLREEAAEFADAVAKWSRTQDDATETELLNELSDLLLQVLFHAELARRRGSFDLDDVAAAFVSKMHSRAPYLFDGGDDVITIAEQERYWEEGKRREKGIGQQ
ncbi:MazG nucleotide pyrophosphohydrolase domain-containing protein [Corynebacterium hindlerae]|uniref:MazG nucleotide pyrophosphohydrolase domain-containing protein n=1 Tax=Corynebacterium hindlerae TaxID=699041 RepID=UPI003AADD1FB